MALLESYTVTVTRRLAHFTESKLLLFPLSYFIHYTMASRYALYYTTTIILLFTFSHKYSHIMPLLLPLLPPVGGLDIGAKDENDIELMNHKTYNNVSWPSISFLYLQSTFRVIFLPWIEILSLLFLIKIVEQLSFENELRS